MPVYKEVSDPRLRYLRQFQSDRLAVDYADLRADPKYQKAADFFTLRLYNTEDTTERDEAFVKIYTIAKRFLGGEVVKSMTKLIELHELSQKLDADIIVVLEKTDAAVEFDMETYERAYRQSDNYDERVLQIDLTEFTLRLVHKISHRPGVGLVLRGLHTALKIHGDTRMVDFLMDGYEAFRNMRKIDPFVDRVLDHERKRLDRIYADRIQA